MWKVWSKVLAAVSACKWASGIQAGAGTLGCQEP